MREATIQADMTTWASRQEETSASEDIALYSNGSTNRVANEMEGSIDLMTARKRSMIFRGVLVSITSEMVW